MGIRTQAFVLLQQPHTLHRRRRSKRALTFVSSRAAIGLLMLFTNLLTCSKCRVISVASTMSITACLSVRNWFLQEGKQLSLEVSLIQSAALGQRGAQERRPPVGVLEDVALAVPYGQLEGEGGVVALQHGGVVVEDGQVAASVTQEGVGPAWVVHVVHRGRYQSSHLIQLVQTALDKRAQTERRRQHRAGRQV